MKKRLLLWGAIGCGKSTMIRNALGSDVLRAGGYVTLRVTQGDRLLGFDLAPARALEDPRALSRAQRFLDFQAGIRQDLSVFSGLGAELLHQALRCPFALADEFGGMELLEPAFLGALRELLRSDVPCIGVMKTPQASRELIRRTGLGNDYEKAYEALCVCLLQDPHTQILTTTGRYDAEARKAVEDWVSYYVRK